MLEPKVHGAGSQEGTSRSRLKPTRTDWSLSPFLTVSGLGDEVILQKPGPEIPEPNTHTWPRTRLLEPNTHTWPKKSEPLTENPGKPRTTAGLATASASKVNRPLSHGSPSRTMAVSSLWHPNLSRISSGAHLSQKHARKGILRNVVQPSQRDPLQSHHIP